MEGAVAVLSKLLVIKCERFLLHQELASLQS